MEKFSLALPCMFGDHHVVEVRRILAALPGVEEIYASSGFQMIEATYDPNRLDPETIRAALQEAGYLEESLAPVEIHVEPADRGSRQPFFRHTAAFPNIQQSIGFKQDVPFSGRPLWPCPGFSVTPDKEEVEHG